MHTLVSVLWCSLCFLKVIILRVYLSLLCVDTLFSLFQDIYVPGLLYFFCGGLSVLCVDTLFCLFQDIYVPGLLYFVCGGLSVLCVGALFWLPETKDANLSDKLNQTVNTLKVKK